MRYLKLVCAGVLLGLGTGCASTADIKVDPAVDMNPAEAGKPGGTLQIRFFQLKRKEKFAQASFAKLWENYKDVLQDDYIDHTEMTLYPGKPPKERIRLNLAAETKYIGAMGNFVMEEEGWRQVVDKDVAEDFKWRFTGYKIVLVKD